MENGKEVRETDKRVMKAIKEIIQRGNDAASDYNACIPEGSWNHGCGAADGENPSSGMAPDAH